MGWHQMKRLMGASGLVALMACSGEADPAGSSADRPRSSAEVPLPPGAPLRLADNGDGTYTNPPLLADFPDPSIIRVEDTFYFATTTFANVPGLTILTSKDLVNWTYAGHVIEGPLRGAPDYDLEERGAYRRGIFAPSLRYRDGVFYVAVTPVGQNTRIYQTPDVTGDWTYHEIDHEAFDPAILFDDDGSVYLLTASAFPPEGEGGVITMLTLSEDLTDILSTEVIHFIPGAEGTKILKRNGLYYM